MQQGLVFVSCCRRKSGIQALVDDARDINNDDDALIPFSWNAFVTTVDFGYLMLKEEEGQER